MGRIITFYSYKGGTGRSMALANVAWLLAGNGNRVLIVDWDLEAPGLHRYFRPFLTDKELTSYASRGLIDYIFDFAKQAATPEEENLGGRDWYKKAADVTLWKTSLQWPDGQDLLLGPRGRGRIDFIPAGRQDEDYGTRVNTFQWTEFYQRSNGSAFMDAVRAKMGDYDYTLIDSRTGLSDTSGICTVQMPDMLVICFTLNVQSITGAAAVARSVAAQRKEMPIFPVPMRVEPFENEKLNRMRRFARVQFRGFPNTVHDEQRYWFNMEVQYVPRYAFEEFLAPFEEQEGVTGSILPSIERLANYLNNGPVEATSLSDEQRSSVMAEYRSLPMMPRELPRPAARAPFQVVLAAWAAILVVLFALTWSSHWWRAFGSGQEQRGELVLKMAKDQRASNPLLAALLLCELRGKREPVGGRKLAKQLAETGVPYLMVAGSNLTYSPDNKCLATRSGSNIAVTDLGGCSYPQVITAKSSIPVRFSDDGTLLLAYLPPGLGSSTEVQVFDLRTGTLKWHQQFDVIYQASLVGNDKVIVNETAPSRERMFQVFDIQNGSKSEILSPRAGAADALVSSAGRIGWFYASQSGFDVDVWSIADGTRLFEGRLPIPPSFLQSLRVSSTFESGCWRVGDALEVWDIRNNGLLTRLDQIAGIFDWRLSRSGNLITVITNKDVRVYRAQGGLLKEIYGSANTLDAIISPAENYLGVTNSLGSFIYRLDTPAPAKNANWATLLDYLRSNTRACLSAADRQKYLGESEGEAQSAYHQCEVAEGGGKPAFSSEKSN